VRGTEERLSLRDAAEALGISEVTARRWVKSGKLKAYQPGRKYLIPESAVEELLEEAEAPKVLLPFDVLEVNARVVQAANPKTSKELRDALDAEYVRQLEDWSLEQLLETEDLLLEEYKELLSAIPPLGKQIEDHARYHRWTRVADELRAVMVARVAQGVPKREELQRQVEGD
jgi:excisionase family DNA binding protein